MSAKQAPCEDQAIMEFHDLYASPAKSEASSVDIYDGLDVSAITAEIPKPSSPSRDCLDLYEEIITEEGTAKETTFNTLSEEYEKCQKQMKQLISKLKEMQCLNTNLQNENQCLKKNISALIKTARVEITRKEEQIKSLSQRFRSPGMSAPLPCSRNAQLKDHNLSKDARNKESSVRKEVKPQEASSSEVANRYLSPKNPELSEGSRIKETSKTKDVKPQEASFKDLKCISSTPNNHLEQTKSIGNALESASKTPYVKQCKNSTELQKQTSKHKPEVDKSKRMIDLEGQNRDTVRRRRNEGHRSSIGAATDSSNFEVKEKSYEQLTKSERSQDRNSKSDVNYKTDCRKYYSSSHDKPKSVQESVQVREQHRSEEKHVKTNDRYPQKKEPKGLEREKTVEHKRRMLEKEDELWKLRRSHSSSLKNESSRKSSPTEPNNSKRNIHSERRDKYYFENDSKNENKESKTSKNTDRSSGIKNKYSSESKGSSDREKSSEKKRSKAEQDRSRSDQRHKGTKEENEKAKKMSSKDKMQDCLRKAGQNSQNSENNLPGQKGENSEKDLKLSFMETLNLTLSPIKKNSQAVDPVIFTVSSSETDTNNVNTEEASSKVCLSTEDKIDTQEHLDNPKPKDVMHSEPVPVEETVTQMASSDYCKSVSPLEPTEYSVALPKEQPSAVTCDEEKTLIESVSSVVKCQQGKVDEPEAVSSDDMDTQSLVNYSDLIVLDSFIEIDQCGGSESASENSHTILPAANPQNDGEILEQRSDHTEHRSSLKQKINETTTGICESSNTDQCVHDESSVMSIDLHFIRRLSKVVSPLKSPARPLAHLHTTERAAKASLGSIVNEGLESEPNVSIPNDVNKENCEPVKKTDANSEAFHIEISSDEVEDGEIASDEDLKCEQLTPAIGCPIKNEPVKDTKNRSPASQESKMATLSKSIEVILPLKQPVDKSKKAKDHGKAKFLALPAFKRKHLNANSCLEGVLNIVPPSSIQDVLQMLRIIRKHIRKKYMKFKIQFPVTQFHRFIEAATLYFTTLVSSLDWSRLCSSPERLQKKLCKLVESRIRPIRKNGIVDRIFEQRLIDMKKRLWKFVEEQFDSLVDAFKGIVIKLCDKAKSDCDTDEKKICITSSTKKKKSQNGKKLKSKACLRTEHCLRGLDIHHQTDVNKNPQSANASVFVKKLVKDGESNSFDQNISAFCDATTLESKDSPLSAFKPHNPECQKEQPSSSGLSFNLVSDDHMGDIFKSLLHDTDNTEPNTIHEDVWILDTPEKPTRKCNNLELLPEIKSPIKAAFSWPSISPPCIDTLSRLETVLNPDVLDESCLLEVPTRTSSSKSMASSEDKLKAYSVLMDDLAVSLTVPSPLKSDSHLSFLRPASEPESVSQVNIRFSEDALLDEEDATEQDIHLTLDSDNSSTGSLENSTDPDGFQCRPSEPMQAVIMEKSNDHFIVKIRRAVSSGSPLSDSSSVAEGDNAAKDKLESILSSSHAENLQQPIFNDARTKDSSANLLLESRVPECEEIKGKSGHVGPLSCSPPKTMQSILVSPKAINQSLTSPFESCIGFMNDIKPTGTERNQKDCDNIVGSLTEEAQMDCGKIETACTEKIINNQTPSADKTVAIAPEVECLNLNKRKRQLSREEPSSKRRHASSLPDAESKSRSPRKRRPEDKDKHLTKELPHRKHKRAASEGNVHFSSSKDSPNGGISAKNVIKKKGEVVVSWTRNEDREILLECQKRGPMENTFIALASKINRYPDQVEERFRQLMKLFKKSKTSTS